jgi:hypothetical protein
VVQWQVSTNGGKTFTNDTTDSGNASHTLTVAGTSVAQNGYEYRAVFQNIAGAAASAAATLTVSSPIALRPPAASFAWFPAVPHAGEPVSFASNSTDPLSPITGFAWDTAGNGPFTPGGSVLTTYFASPGSHVVRLRVTDGNGLSSVATETIPVTSPQLILLQPFPIVRIVGSYTPSGVRLVLFSVLAPYRARITVTCRGKGCPARVASRLAIPRRSIHKTPTVLVRFRRFEQSLLRPGVILQVRVWKIGEVGKYVKFVIRRGKLPVRYDGCLTPATPKPTTCPSS